MANRHPISIIENGRLLLNGTAYSLQRQVMTISGNLTEEELDKLGNDHSVFKAAFGRTGDSAGMGALRASSSRVQFIPATVRDDDCDCQFDLIGPQVQDFQVVPEQQVTSPEQVCEGIDPQDAYAHLDLFFFIASEKNDQRPCHREAEGKPYRGQDDLHFDMVYGS